MSGFSVFHSHVLVDEKALDGQHLVVKCKLHNDNKDISVNVLVDCRATGFSFIDEEYAHQHNFPLFELKVPQALEVIDDREILSGDITQMTRIPMTISDHQEELPAFVTKLSHYSLVLGIPWLRHHGVVVDFSSGSVFINASRQKDGHVKKRVDVQGDEPGPRTKTNK